MENQGGSASAGSHWEKSVLMNELMASSLSGFDSMYTRFTLAYLKDSNWYAEVDLS
jgi:hypothetical protein